MTQLEGLARRETWAEPARGRGGADLSPDQTLCLPRAARRDSWATEQVQELGFVGRPERFSRQEAKGRQWEAEP